MFKTILAILTLIGIPFSLCSQQKTNMDKTQANARILVAYFSATGTTAKVAEKLADATAGELHAIVPAQPYTSSTSTGTTAVPAVPRKPTIHPYDLPSEERHSARTVLMSCFWAIQSGGTWHQESSTPSLKATTSRVKQSYRLPPQAVAAFPTA